MGPHGSINCKKFQNRAARRVANSDFDTSAAPLLQVLGWSTVETLIHREFSTMAFKCLNNLASGYLSGAFLNCQFAIIAVFVTQRLTCYHPECKNPTDKNPLLIVVKKFGMILT